MASKAISVGVGIPMIVAGALIAIFLPQYDVEIASTIEFIGSANSDNTVKSNEQASGFEQTQDGQASGSMVGIDGLMDKRIKLEESINYVGHMIKTLKDKRSRLEKQPL